MWEKFFLLKWNWYDCGRPPRGRKSMARSISCAQTIEITRVNRSVGSTESVYPVQPIKRISSTF